MTGDARDLFSKKAHLLVAGPMGVGKSTTASALSQHLDLPLYLESSATHNPYLERFYADMSRWAFASQTFFIAEALTQAQQIATERRGGVQDRSAWEHLGIFATSLLRAGHLSVHDITLLEQITRLGLGRLPTPDLMIYLHAPYQDIAARIQERGREYEKSVSQRYLSEHVSAYETWVEGFTICPVLSVDTSEDDLRDPHNMATLVRRIKREFNAVS